MYCNTLDELSNHIDLEILKIPDEVKLYDSQLKTKKFTFKRSVSTDNSVITVTKHGPFQQFRVSLET